MAATTHSSTVHVLLVDDDRVTCHVVAGLLRRCQYQVTTASSGREAMALLERGTQFNLLLTDVMMPDVDGPTLLHFVRNNPLYAEMPVVMMSSNEHADMVMNCIRLGAEDYIIKPVTNKAVKHMWAHVWRRKQRYQMVPRFENGREVDEEREFEAAAMEELRGGVDLEAGMLPVPETEEYSSDGESDDDEARRGDAAAEFYAMEYANASGGWEGGTDFGSVTFPGAAGASASDGGCPMGHHARGGRVGKRAKVRGGTCPFAAAGGGTNARDPDAKMDAVHEVPDEEEDAATAAAAAADGRAAPARATATHDPLVVTDEMTGVAKRLVPVPPMRNLTDGRRTLREWIDLANRDGLGLVERRDALHVLGRAASLLASHHDRGMLLGAMRPSALTISPQGEVGIAPPRPTTPPRTNPCSAGAAAVRGARRKARRAWATSNARRDGDEREPGAGMMNPDEDEDDVVDADDEYDEMMDSDDDEIGGEMRVPSPCGGFAAGAGGDANESLYVSPEEKTAAAFGAEGEAFGGWRPSASSECFALGVLMVELCWPDVAASAVGDVGKLLRAVLRPDGDGAAELARDPTESAIARQLLQPVPGNRPTASQVAALLTKYASEIEDAAAAASGWATTREMGAAVERRRAELIALADFLRRHREARVREAQGHRVRSALLAHALRQLVGPADAQAAVGRRGMGTLSVGGGGGRRNSGDGRPSRQNSVDGVGANVLSRQPSFEGPGPSERRGVSFDLPRGGLGLGLGSSSTLGFPGANAAASRRPRRGSNDGSGDALELGGGGSGRSSMDAEDGGAGPPAMATATTALTTVAGADRALGNGRSFSANDLTALDASASAAKAVGAGLKPASELDDEAFNALEEDFFDACARAIAPIARKYANATKAASLEPSVVVTGSSFTALANASAHSTAIELKRAAGAEAARDAGIALAGAMDGFGADLARCVRRTTLNVVADVSIGHVHSFGEMVCSTGWDRDGEYIATGGISKRLRVFEVAAVTELGAAVHCPVSEIKTNSKLSSLAWNPYIKHGLASADYDGSVHLWDADRGVLTSEFNEHRKRVWSLDYSQLDPTRLVSGSDDGTVRVWSISQATSVSCIRQRANVCSVQFSPVNANVVAFGSADYKIYAYDLRHTSRPLVTLSGHKKAVSYVRWMGGDLIVSASTDNTLKLWDVKRGMVGDKNEFASGTGGGLFDPGSERSACSRTFRGHLNQKNFVGMSVARDGHIACGSEDNTVCLYTRSVPSPITTQSLATCSAFNNPSSGGCGLGGGERGLGGGGGDAGAGAAGGGDKTGLFVSSVAWSPDGRRLVAANSCGAVKIMEVTN